MNLKCQVLDDFFSGSEVPNTYKYVFGLDGIGRNIAFVSDWRSKGRDRLKILIILGCNDVEFFCTMIQVAVLSRVCVCRGY